MQSTVSTTTANLLHRRSVYHSCATFVLLQHDYGKPGLPDSVLGKIWETTLNNLYYKKSSNGTCSFALEYAFEEQAVKEYGAASGWTSLTISPSTAASTAAAAIDVEVTMYNKSTTRLPEAAFMTFQVVRLL